MHLTKFHHYWHALILAILLPMWHTLNTSEWRLHEDNDEMWWLIRVDEKFLFMSFTTCIWWEEEADGNKLSKENIPYGQICSFGYGWGACLVHCSPAAWQAADVTWCHRTFHRVAMLLPAFVLSRCALSHEVEGWFILGKSKEQSVFSCASVVCQIISAICFCPCDLGVKPPMLGSGSGEMPSVVVPLSWSDTAV